MIAAVDHPRDLGRLLAYTRVRPDLVVEVSADLALDGLRWRHPVRFVRARTELHPGDLGVIDS